MKIRWMETLGRRSLPAPRMITLPQRALADHDESSRGNACARTYSWAQTSNCAWAMGAVALALGLHIYYVREMLASLALFGVFFFSLTLVTLGVFFACYAGNQAALWAGRASRFVIAFFQRHDGEAELYRVPVVEDGRRLSDERSEVQTQRTGESSPRIT
jgi:hypothetical protein